MSNSSKTVKFLKDAKMWAADFDSEDEISHEKTFSITTIEA